MRRLSQTRWRNECTIFLVNRVRFLFSAPPPGAAKSVIASRRIESKQERLIIGGTRGVCHWHEKAFNSLQGDVIKLPVWMIHRIRTNSCLFPSCLLCKSYCCTLRNHRFYIWSILLFRVQILIISHRNWRFFQRLGCLLSTSCPGRFSLALKEGRCRCRAPPSKPGKSALGTSLVSYGVSIQFFG